MILSACMMLDHIGETKTSDRIKKAIEEVIAAGKHFTYDMLKLSGGPDAIKKGAASTDQLTGAIIKRL
jgi:3-isopropylmalate dehydrogenase